jgi:hypothetical protein
MPCSGLDKAKIFVWLIGLTLVWRSAELSAGQTDVDCNIFYNKRECEATKAAASECDWRRAEGETALPGGGTCENKRDFIYQSTLEPFIRPAVEDLEPRGGGLQQVSNYKCIGSLITEIAQEPCYAMSTMDLDHCSCTGDLDFSYLIPRQKDVARLILTPKLLLNDTLFMFIHVNKAAGETVKNIAYQALAANRWDGTGFGTRTGWQFLDKRRTPYAFPNWQRRNPSRSCKFRAPREIFEERLILSF